MIVNVGRARHAPGELADAHGATHLVERTVGTQLLGDGEHVDGALTRSQRLDGGVDFLVGIVVEHLGFQDVRHFGKCRLLEHQRSEHGFLDLQVLRLQLAHVAHHLRVVHGPAAIITVLVIVVRHDISVLVVFDTAKLAPRMQDANNHAPQFIHKILTIWAAVSFLAA